VVGLFCCDHLNDTANNDGCDVKRTRLILITLVAGTVNGALGYGFSSITVPVALLFYTNRVLIRRSCGSRWS